MQKTIARSVPAALTAVLSAVVLVLVAGCGGSSSKAEAAGTAAAFKVGVAGCMTGQYAAHGAAHKAGAQVAVDELNAKGGVNGAKASFESSDDRGDPEEAVRVAQKLIDDPSIVVVDGHTLSGATLAAGARYETAGLPMISPAATNPDVSTLGSYIWRLCMTDAVQGQSLAAYAVNTLGKKTVGIIYDSSDYGRGLADAFKKGVAAAGGAVVASRQYAAGDTDFRAQLTGIRDGSPDLLFLSGYYPEGVRIAAQARELGMTMPLLSSDSAAFDELPRLGGEAVEGMLVATFFDDTKDDPRVKAFVDAYKARYGGNPDWVAANSYDVIMLAAAAAEKAGSNGRAAINEALAAMGEYQGVSGTLTFDENGDVIKPLSIMIVKDGRLVTAPQQPAP